MLIALHRHGTAMPGHSNLKPYLRTMKILMMLLLGASLSVAATGHSQTISLSVRNAPLHQILKTVEQQSPYRFIYSRQHLPDSLRLNLELKQVTLTTFLDLLRERTQLLYEVEDHFVFVKPNKAAPLAKSPVVLHNIDIRGKVTNGEGYPLAGISIQVKGTSNGTRTNTAGEFQLVLEQESAVLVISGAEHETLEVRVGTQRYFPITLVAKIGELDETIVIGYGTTSKRLNTGSVSKVTSTVIERQLVSNPMAALAGRVPGLMISSANGLPGSNVHILLRGEHSLRQGTQPLVVIDGVPFMLNSERLTSLNSTDNQSLFNTIDPADIESVEVLKDASATAIYGSQGANGVILITTKKGRQGKLKVDAQIYMGFKRATRTMDLLHTSDYLAMRREAFQNDQLTPTSSNAPDLTEWDPAAYTDWKKELIGGTAQNNNYKLTLSGGSDQTQFLVSGNLYSETLVFPDNEPARRVTARLQVNHATKDKKLQINFASSYGADIKRQSLSDLTQFIFLPPNAPQIRDSYGQLLWTPGIDNPYAFLQRQYQSHTYSYFNSVDIDANLAEGLSLKVNAGYNKVDSRETATVPIRSLRPDPTARGTYHYSNGSLEGWIAEPQLHYTLSKGPHRFQLLAGSSLQSRQQQGLSLTATGFTDDDQLHNTTAAENIATTATRSLYRYTALFGRVHYNFQRKYVVDLNLRRDGSSRFGPAERFSNFAAIGGGWVFSDEAFLRPAFKEKILHFGKLRASYGTTGNDQIGNYQYFDGWGTNTMYQYGGNPGFLPQRLFNSSLQWERTTKLQVGADLEFFKGKLSLSLDYYRNLSDNQLTFVGLPQTTGFTTVLKNLDASILNYGFEVFLQWKVIDRPHLSWTTSFNATVPRNRLLRYPNLEGSSDASLYIIGEPLRIARRFQLQGVDPQTGLYQFQDFNHDGLIRPLEDWGIAGTLGQKSFGGLDNSVRYKNWNLHVFFQFVQQTGNNYLTSLPDVPGTLSNQPVGVLQRWRAPGDLQPVQRYTSSASPATTAYTQYLSSSATVTNASFVRFKNVQLSYELPKRFLQSWKVQQLRFYVSGQDLLTITNYAGADPETRNVRTLPLLRTLAFGAQLTL